MANRIDYIPFSHLLPVEDVLDVNKWHRFVSPEMDEILYSLIAKVFLNAELVPVIHRSFVNALQEVINRKAKRGHDYVIFSMWKEDGWYIHARIDRNFISPEDVINE